MWNIYNWWLWVWLQLKTMEKFQLGNTGLDSTIRTANDANVARFGHLNKIVDTINSTANKFDVTFTGLEFRNIATTPLVLVQSNKAVIITSANAILSDQTEAFDFNVAIGIDTGSAFPQFVEAGFASESSYFNSINASFGFLVAYQNETIGTGNAFIKSKGSDATTGDGIVRIIGTYYEIDL